MRRLHPLRLSYAIFGASNPFLTWVEGAADRVREDRRPADPDNPLLALQEQVSRQIVDGLDAWRKGAERLAEQTFHAIYATPALQAALGIDTASSCPPRKAARSKLHQALVARRIGELKAEMTRGGLAEAVVRALVYVACRGRGVVDERGFAAIRGIRGTLPPPTRGRWPSSRRSCGTSSSCSSSTRRQRCSPFRICSQIDRGAPGGVRRAAGARGAQVRCPRRQPPRLQEVAALFGLGPGASLCARVRRGLAAARIGSPVRPQGARRS